MSIRSYYCLHLHGKIQVETQGELHGELQGEIQEEIQGAAQCSSTHSLKTRRKDFP